MSILGKKWLIKNNDKQKSILEKILENRDFRNLNELRDFYDPFLFNDMERAVSRIDRAIKSREHITIFGDYDVDGISGTAILVHILRKLNANVDYMLPNRVTDGYGLSEKFINEFIEKKVGLIITVDCGISCSKEIAKAKENNIDTIITDHHTIPETFPDKAFAILHPKIPNSTYPFSELTGAGVALKLAHALIKKYLPEPEQNDYLNSLLDLAALGTIADLGPLRDENRLIVSKGLDSLANTKWSGLKRIKELANIKEGDIIDTVKIGFQIAPRINAAGRIGNALTALSLLLNENDEEITLLSNELETLNHQRQDMTEQALKEAEKCVLVDTDMPYILIAHSPDWHVGILGLIAGKLAEKYARPAIAMRDCGDVLVASARSPEYFNIVEALTKHKKYLVNFGGHAQAAGFNINKDKLEEFTKEISLYAKERLEKLDLKTVIEIDCELNENEIDFELLDQIEKLQPFGVDNKKPIFVMQNVEPHFVDKVGHDGSHLKFTARFNTRSFPVIAFRMGQFTERLRKHPKIDLVFQLDRHNWNNKESIQFQALDFRINE